MSPSAFDRDRAAQTMIRDARDFYRSGWMPGTSGNLSVRAGADAFLITASGRDKSRLEPGDFLLCGLDGAPVEPTDARPSAETLIHCAVYERFPEAGAVYHIHELHAALCSARDRPDGRTTFRSIEMIKGLDVWEADAEVAVEIVDNHADIPRLADAVRARITRDGFDARVPAINIADHGFYAWGADPFEAKRHVETLAYLFRYAWKIAAITTD